jgi:hypothetical protein
LLRRFRFSWYLSRFLAHASGESESPIYAEAAF